LSAEHGILIGTFNVLLWFRGRINLHPLSNAVMGKIFVVLSLALQGNGVLFHSVFLLGYTHGLGHIRILHGWCECEGTRRGQQIHWEFKLWGSEHLGQLKYALIYKVAIPTGTQTLGHFIFGSLSGGLFVLIFGQGLSHLKTCCANIYLNK
jgi:hypothetical protein